MRHALWLVRFNRDQLRDEQKTRKEMSIWDELWIWKKKKKIWDVRVDPSSLSLARFPSLFLLVLNICFIQMVNDVVTAGQSFRTDPLHFWSDFQSPLSRKKNMRNTCSSRWHMNASVVPSKCLARSPFTIWFYFDLIDGKQTKILFDVYVSLSVELPNRRASDNGDD